MSPTLTSSILLILAVIYPTSPQLKLSLGLSFGVVLPKDVTSYTAPVLIILILSFNLTVPSTTLIKATMPL